MIGYFYLFVSLMQLVEYFIWKDINCKTGLNMIGASLGPILNHLQPVVMLLLLSYYMKSSKRVPKFGLYALNTVYLFYVFVKYIEYIYNKDNLCVKTNSCGHINWTWKGKFDYIFYFAVSIVNSLNYLENTNFMVTFIISYILLFISIFQFNKNIGEFWCLMVTGVPFANIFIQRFLGINN